MNPVLLLVDDDEAIRTQMKWALSADYEIVSAEDRAGAIENFKKKKPAVTLLDRRGRRIRTKVSRRWPN